MANFKVTNSVKGTEIGVFKVKSEDEALEEMACKFGYGSYDEACEKSDAWAWVAAKINE